MKTILWTIINSLRVTFAFAMTAVWITVALTVLLLTWNRNLALMMAHYCWAPTMLFSVRSRLQVEGLENVNFEEPHIFAMNHQSTLDIPVIFKAIPVPLRFVAKKELAKIPFLGWYIAAMGMVFVDRSNTDKAIQSMKIAGKLIRNGVNILTYPEGTRSKDGYILPFKKGTFALAIESGVPVVPVAIERSRLVMPTRTLKIYPTTIRVKFGKPIPTKDLSFDQKEYLMQQVRNEVVRLNIELGGLGGIEQKMISSEKQKQVA